MHAHSFPPTPPRPHRPLVAFAGKGKAPAGDKGKGKVGEEAADGAAPGARYPGDDGVALATMDIFAGCGGLSEGMHQAGEPMVVCQ